MVRDANHFHQFEDGVCFLHGLLVMLVVCFFNCYIKYILFIAYLMV
jgi:uncharacterized membrane protein (DUF485 family)